MIEIKEIIFNNYRQYKKVNVNFEDDSNYKLHILRAKNGTGKTTFLNGILWCLYEKEMYITDQNTALPIINESAVQEANNGDEIVVSVNIKVSDDGDFIYFERIQKFKVSYNSLNNNMKMAVSTGNSSFRITKTTKDANTKIFDNEEDTALLLKQYFDPSIYNYYFFDGENLKNYFDKVNSKSVKGSIFNISQVTLLENAYNRVKNMQDEKARKYGKENGFDENIYNRQSKLEEDIRKYESENEENEKNIPEIEKEINQLSNQLKNYAPIKSKQEQRERLENELKDINEEFNSFKLKKKKFIRESIINLSLYPYAEVTAKTIKEKQEKGLLPPSIDKKQIEDIINNHIKNCPVCDGEINEHAIKHLRAVLNQLEVSASTSNYLMEIKGSLENLVKKAKEYDETKKDLLSREKYFLEKIKSITEELNQLSAFFANNEVQDISKIETNYRNKNRELQALEDRIGSNKELIEAHKEELKEINAQIEKYENQKQEYNLLKEQVKVLRKISSNLDRFRTNIMNEIKNEIENKTWEYFSNMIWKKDTFKRININDNYELTVFNINDNEMTGSMSATETMALAYAFTLAVHEVSGQNCPLVVDSPLGRVSDENRINMANELLKISESKQIIMLFTPDEYSQEVKDIYEGVISSNRLIKLADNEKEIKGVIEENG